MKGIFQQRNTAKLAIIGALAIQLVACGGGGGGGGGGAGGSSSGSTSSTASASTTVSPATQANATTTSSSGFTVSGTVKGLASGATLTLSDNSSNGTNSASINANGAFSFSNPLTPNGSYAVTVGTQPAGQVCTVSNGSGSGVNANITNISVACSSDTYTISGTVSGLAGSTSVTLLDNGANPQTISANGSFTLSTPVAYDAGYALTVAVQPNGQICTVTNGSGAGVVANVSGVSVACSTNTYTVSGAVSGLSAGQQVTILNNGADAQTLTSSGTFSFATPVAYNGSYSVTIGTQPVGQQCTVSNGSGSGVVANVSGVSITCSTLSYSIAGNLSGLNSGQQVTLLNNGSDPITLTANSFFAFGAAVAYNGSYSVTVSTQPVGQTCSVTNGSGSGVVASVSNISVVCSNLSYTVGGSVSGLVAGQQVTLLDNASNAKTVTSNGTFSFSAPVSYNGSYSVTVGTQPTNEICSVTNSSASGVSANVSNISVSCSADTYTVGGSVSGLGSGAQVTLLNNGANPVTVTANASFNFSVPVAFGSSYAVTVGTQPVGETCTVSNGSGSTSANVSNVSISCVNSSNMVYSPYFYFGDYNDSSDRLMTALTVNYPTVQTMLSVMPSNLNTATWAFATGTCGSETWSGVSGAAFAAANVPAYVAAGKKYIVSTGGSGYQFLCSSNASFLTFIQTYYSANMVGVDFDIESGQTQAQINSLVQVAVAAQSTYPNLRFSFTVGSNGGNVFEVDSYTTMVWNAIKAYGLKNYTFNLMVMQFTSAGNANSSVCTLATGTTNVCNMGLSAIQAAVNMHNTWGIPYNQIELTPMIGNNNGGSDEIFSIADASVLSSFALANNLAGVHFWEFSRDRACVAGVTNSMSDTCNLAGPSGALGFTNAFLTGLGY